MHNTLKQCVPLLTADLCCLSSTPPAVSALLFPAASRACWQCLCSEHGAFRRLCDHSKSKKGGVHHELMALHDKDGDGAVSNAEFHEL